MACVVDGCGRWVTLLAEEVVGDTSDPYKQLQDGGHVVRNSVRTPLHPKEHPASSKEHPLHPMERKTTTIHPSDPIR